VKNYRHQFIAGNDVPDTVTKPYVVTKPDSLTKIVCVGRNYAEHARELNNPVPQQPLLFIKPATAAVSMLEPITIPKGQGACHHELEMSVLVAEPLTNATLAQARSAVVGIGLALDLTLRDLQDVLKQKGHPWERAKAFDGACPLSPFVSVKGVHLQQLSLELFLNGQRQQVGNTADMLFPVYELLVEISRCFSLLPGDVVLTGTPAGVGPLVAGDKLRARLSDLINVETVVN
jgi:2-keto-4-pentenoate hydratase/2-oxohepta-3-ene-1,7-dioic acid hydratase in catechol pathway